MRGEWIEIENACSNFRRKASLPMRGEWIEIPVGDGRQHDGGQVSPHAGRVD